MKLFWFSILTFLLSLNVYALPLISFPQTISASLIVANNPSKHPFKVKFKTTDYFDTYHESKTLQEGEVDQSFTYQHGPKNIKFEVGIVNANADANIIISDDCWFLTRVNDHWFESIIIPTKLKHQHWVFHVYQGSIIDFRHAVYYLSCRMFSGNTAQLYLNDV